MYEPRTARGFNPLSKPLTPAEYATLYAAARSRASWLLRNNAAQLDREIEQERVKLTARQEESEAEITQLRNKVRQRQYTIRHLNGRLDVLDGEHEILKHREEALQEEARARTERIDALTDASKRRVRGLVSVEELELAERAAEKQLAARRLEEATAERFGSGPRHGHPSHKKTTNRFFLEKASA